MSSSAQYQPASQYCLLESVWAQLGYLHGCVKPGVGFIAQGSSLAQLGTNKNQLTFVKDRNQL